jgi:hypothetical protein
MLELNPEIVQFIIDKAQQFQVKDEVILPDDAAGQSDDWAQQMLAAHGDDPVFQELKSAIEDLEPDQQVSLVALMWVGRGDYTVEEWSNAIEHAQDSWNERTAEYLIGTPLLADYLAEGLEQMELGE